MGQDLVSASKRWEPLGELLGDLVGRIAEAIPGCLGTGLSIRKGTGPINVLAARGIPAQLAPAQLDRFGGPILDAATTGEAIMTGDVFADPRWPNLTEHNLTSTHPDLAEEWKKVRGVVALPSVWDDDGTLVLSAVLDSAADPGTLGVLRRYEPLTIATLAVAQSATADPHEILRVLASRTAIEEAKGAIIAVRYCSPDEAWATLVRASQEFNVKVRELAVALIETLGNAPPPHPDGTSEIVPTPAARQAAELLWAALAGRTTPDD